ncbi:MAG: hypothetical protein LBP58_05080 [Azoarcus sp.]|jgi:Ca2+-binding RTX toxin-like protein|nr:hypothetical protein [Azoarcus sp.]
MATSLISVAGSLLNLLNPFHYVKLATDTPSLVLNTIQTIADTAHEVKYQTPVDAIWNVTTTVTETIGAIATKVAPGGIGNLVAFAANAIGTTIGTVANAVASPNTISEAVIDSTKTIIDDSVIPIVNALIPTPISSILGGIATTVKTSITSVSNFVDNFLGDTPQQLTAGNTFSAILAGRAGADVVTGGDRSDLLLGGAGDDAISGGNGNDTILAGKGDDAINGDLGKDSLHGGDGNDQIFGGEGDDKLYGENGADVLLGDAGNDKLYGGAQNDVLYGGEGADLLNGGTGNDSYLFDAASGSDTIYEEGGEGDVLLFTGLSAIDGIAKNGSDLLIVYAGSNNITVVDYFLDASHTVEALAFDADGNGEYESTVGIADLLAEIG